MAIFATMFAVVFVVAQIWNHEFVKVAHCIFNKLTKVVCIALALASFVRETQQQNYGIWKNSCFKFSSLQGFQPQLEERKRVVILWALKYCGPKHS